MMKSVDGVRETRPNVSSAETLGSISQIESNGYPFPGNGMAHAALANFRPLTPRPETRSCMLCRLPEVFILQGNVRPSSVLAKMAEVW